MNQGSRIVSCLCIALSLLGVDRALAATNTVTSTSNTGAGSLRQTVLDSDEGDTIDFSVAGTITLTTGEIALDKDLTLAGPGADQLTVSGNNASRIFNVASNATVTISGLALTDGNDATGAGGAIRNAGTLTITESSVSTSQAGAGDELSGGGGIFNADTGRLTIQNSTIDNNQATGGTGDESGGGLYNAGGSVSIATSTFSGNHANGTNGFGGAIFNQSGAVGILNSTLAFNTAAGIGGGIANATGSVMLANSIIATNEASASPDASGTFASGGFNFLGNDDGASGIVDGDNDDFAGNADAPLDPLLGPLQNNGGPTATHELLPGSPAINTGDCEDPSTDQRGEPRPVGPACDIGAFEVQACTTPGSTVDCPTTNIVVSVNFSGGGIAFFEDPSFSSPCPGATVSCDPPSGSVFPVGTNTVVCSVLDASGTEQTNCTFEVVVHGPDEVLDDAIALVESFGLDLKLEKLLVKKLEAARKQITSGRGRKACGIFKALITQRNKAVRKGRMTLDQANQLGVPVASVQAFLTCPTPNYRY